VTHGKHEYMVTARFCYCVLARSPVLC